MEKAIALIEAYVAAGFSKIHLDASMSCADDPVPLDPQVVAERAARLCLAAEQTASEAQKKALTYVIGTGLNHNSDNPLHRCFQPQRLEGDTVSFQRARGIFHRGNVHRADAGGLAARHRHFRADDIGQRLFHAIILPS